METTIFLFLEKRAIRLSFIEGFGFSPKRAKRQKIRWVGQIGHRVRFQRRVDRETVISER